MIGAWVAAVAGLGAAGRSGGGLLIAAVGVVVLGLVGRRLPLGPRSWVARGVGALAGGPALGLLVVGAPPREALLALLYALLLARLLSPSGETRGVVWVSGLLLAATSQGDAAWWLAFAPWSVGAFVALSVGPVQPSAALAVMGVATLLWAALPRPARPHPPASQVGFADTLTPGRPPVGAGLDDELLVVEGPQAVAGPLYLRGAVLADFDGTRWRGGDGVWEEAAVGGVGGGTAFRVTSSRASVAIFTAGRVVSLEAGEPVYRDAERARVVARAVTTWQFIAAPPFAEGAVADDEPPSARHLALPPGIVDAVAPLLGPGDLPPSGRMTWALSQFAGMSWSLLAPADQPADVVDFLLRRASGHCAWFASGMAVLARASGLPARVVTGYRAMPDGPGRWVARGADAHAWVEVWLDDRGWVTVDATPAEPTEVPATAPPLGERVVVAVAAGMLAAVALWWARPRGRRPRSVPHSEPERIWWSVAERLRRSGWELPAHLPPWTAAREVARRASDRDAADALCALALLVGEVRWGGRSAAEATGPARLLAAKAVALR